MAASILAATWSGAGLPQPRKNQNSNRIEYQLRDFYPGFEHPLRSSTRPVYAYENHQLCDTCGNLACHFPKNRGDFDICLGCWKKHGEASIFYNEPNGEEVFDLNGLIQ